MPLSSPIVCGFKVSKGHAPQQREHLPLKAFEVLQRIATADCGTVSIFCTGVLFLVCSCLRYAHSCRFTVDFEASGSGCIVGTISKGKSRGRAPVTIATPSHTGPGQDLFVQYFEQLHKRLSLIHI
eukprot:3250495-Karenia_brevis.AAC.1